MAYTGKAAFGKAAVASTGVVSKAPAAGSFKGKGAGGEGGDKVNASHYMRLSISKGNSVVLGNLYPSKDGQGLQVKVSAKFLEGLSNIQEGSYIFINPSKFADE